VDLIFVKCKAKAARRLTYGQFLDALSAMATVRYHDVDDPVTAFSLLLANHVFQCPASVGIAAAVRSGMLQLTPVGGAGGVGASGYAVTATPGYGGGGSSSSGAGQAAEAGSGSVYGGGGGGGGGGSFYSSAPPAPSPGRFGTGAGPIGSPARPGYGATGVLSPSRGASGGGAAGGGEGFSSSGRPLSAPAHHGDLRSPPASSGGRDASDVPGGASASAAAAGAGVGVGASFSGAPSGFIPVIALMPSPGAPGNAAMGVPPGYLPVQVLMPAPSPAAGAVGGAGATPAYPQQYPPQYPPQYPQQYPQPQQQSQQAAENGSGAPGAPAGHAAGLAGDVAGLLAAAGVIRARQMAGGGFSEGRPGSARRQRQPSITSLSSIGGGPGSSVYVGGGGASGGGGMLSPDGLGPGGGALGGAAPYMGSGASVVSYGGQSAVSGARRARSARPSRSPSRCGSMLGSPAFKPTVAGEANRPGGVYDRLSSPDSFTGALRAVLRAIGPAAL
jgi:hypothetical protein